MNPQCNYCGGGYIVKRVKRYNKKITKQLYYCKFWKMKNTPETITEVLNLYEEGFSLQGTAEHLIYSYEKFIFIMTKLKKFTNEVNEFF